MIHCRQEEERIHSCKSRRILAELATLSLEYALGQSPNKLSATEVVYSSEIDGISRQTLTTDRAVYRTQSASGMYGVGMTSTSAPSLKENGDLLLEKYAHAISRELTTSTVFQTEQQRSRSATTQQLTLLYIRELKAISPSIDLPTGII